MGRILLDAIAQGLLNAIHFVFGFIGWTVRWSFATIFFLAVMAGAAFFVFNEAVSGGGYVEVPDITGMSLARASNELAEAGLQTGQQTHVASDRYPEYHVLLQRPESKRVVRRGRKINLTVSAGKQYESAPRLVGRSLEAALKELESSRLIAGSIARKPDSSARDTVIGQDPAPGLNVESGDEIHMLVSDGPQFDSMFMPNIVDLSLTEAKRVLSKLNVDVVPFKVTTTGVPFDTVLSQNPPPGTMLRDGQTISYEVRLSPDALLPNARRRVEVVFTVPAVSAAPEVRVDVVDHLGDRKTIYPRTTEYATSIGARLDAGTIMTVPASFVGEATIEFYVDGEIYKSYYYSGDSEPVVTNYDVAEPSAGTGIGEDLVPPSRGSRQDTPNRWPWR